MEKQDDYIVTARKWRPLRFADIVGQEHITTTLLNTIKSERIHHAYLFSGPRGVGKTTAARILARAVNCLSPVEYEPDNVCQSCTSILESRSLDIIEIDGASNNSVDDVRKLRENAKYPPVTGKYKMYIIDEVHMLSTSAFNALLKTLEEPPPHLLFVFATTEIHKVPATIISRCQRFDFRRIEVDDIVKQIRKIAIGENITIDEESLFTIAKKADGSMRDAQSIFDQAVAFCGGDVNFTELADALNLIDTEFFFRISTAAAEKNIEEMFVLSREVSVKGYDLQDCLNGLLEHYRNLLTIIVTGNTKLLNVPLAFIDKYKIEAGKYSQADVLRILNHISMAIQGFRYSTQPSIKFEITLIQLASFDKTIELSRLLNELEVLKKKLIEGDFKIEDAAIAVSSKHITKEEKIDFKLEDKDTDLQIVKDAMKSDIVGVNESFISYDIDKSLSQTIVRAKISSDELEKGWEGFIGKYGNGGYGLTLLSHLKPDFLDTEIIFYTESQFVTDNIEQKKNLLSKYLQSYYGCKVHWKLITTESITTNQQTDDNFNSIYTANYEEGKNKLIGLNTSNNRAIHSTNNSDKHPVEIALMELFGAEKISGV